MPMGCTGHIFLELHTCTAEGHNNGYLDTDHHVMKVVCVGGREAWWACPALAEIAIFTSEQVTSHVRKCFG